MLITTLAEYHVAPGLLREWTLEGRPFDEAAGSAEGATPLSYNQEWHLKFLAKLAERGATIPMWMGFAFEIPGPLDVEVFRETLRVWVERHETLRSAFRAVGARTERFTVAPDRVSVNDAVLGGFAGSDGMSAWLQERIDDATGAFRWPSHVVETVERADSTTVIVALDHAHTDGLSVMTAVKEWQELYATVAAGRRIDHQHVGSYVDFSVAERAAADRIGADHPAVGAWERFIEAGGAKLLEFPLDLGVAEGELLPHTKLDTRLLDARAAEAVEAACHSVGGGFLAGLLAVFAVVAHEITGEPVYRTVMPLHTRSRSEWLHSMGWYIGIGPVEIETPTAHSFRDVVPLAHQSARTALRLSRVPIVRIAELLGIEEELERRMPEVFPFVSYTDTRVIPGAQRWPEWNARPVVRMKTRGNRVNTWVHRTHEGVWMTVRYPGTETADVGIAGYADHVRDVFRSVARTSDYVYGRPNTAGEAI
ncbi:condensation domain-containing protein [Streptomyces sp. NPDC090442]|uniref:condensation domain-containing protein n=1 Tax=Streptomyces sp. NPDC090442 TaxID=3365962 RepID=UPI0037F738E5